MAKSSEREHRSLLRAISAISRAVEARDSYTADHQRKVAELARRIGQGMNLPEHQVDGIRLGGTLHDIGKIAVPSEILTKPLKLSAHEMGLVKTHAVVGFEILGDVDLPWPIADIIHQHHERLNGSGYPNGLSGDSILLEARIVAVADVVDSIAAFRPYRPAFGLRKALDELSENRDRLYDKRVVDACCCVLTKDPMGYA
ncbi:MAG: HD domain-containing phosphohydrolase [Alphaproteobacteria bacterium]